MGATIVWFRQDLRLEDNTALIAAIRREEPIVPVFIWDQAAEGRWPMGAAARSWLHHSLAALARSLEARGSRLIFARGESAAELMRIARTTAVDAVFWNRRYEAAAAKHEAAVASELKRANVAVETFPDALLHEPQTIRNRQGGPFQVFTPFLRCCQALPVNEPLRLTTRSFPAPRRWPGSLRLEQLELQPRIGWDREFYAHWTPGEAGARKRLTEFLRDDLADYAEQRDSPSANGTSRLSPHLHFGEISPRQVWAAVRGVGRDSGLFPPNRGAAKFLEEVGWREFGYHLLVHFPHTPEEPLRAAFRGFAWARDPGGKRLRAWQRSQTGYPIVDAGMRQLWATGWMHNRVRVIVASFLVKHLRLPWSEGAAWFWDTLVDADLANNTLGWQWSAGCGADAAPYFRIFAPVLQGQRFDPDGAYVRRWVPELAELPPKWIHAPWEAPEDVRAAAGVRLGETYPPPIVDHAEARREALEAFRALKSKTKS